MILFKNKKNTSGFTLIELLVVVSIISLLTSIVLSSLSDARAKARDARRLEDIRTILTAINMYQNDNNGNFPPYDNNGSITATSSISSTFLEVLVSKKYLPSKIVDPLNIPLKYFYFYSKDNMASYCSQANAKAVIAFKLEKMTSTYSRCRNPNSSSFYCACIN